jgi:hypothetical protein
MTNEGAGQDGATRQAAYALGLAGLLPFIGLSALCLAGAGPVLGIAPRMALLTYGAVIASFLGGIRWGVALRGTDHAWRDLGLAVVPSLVAWGCLALREPLDLAALGLLVLAWGLVDQDMPRRSLAPPWFGRLRLLLSGVAGLSLLAAALG